jgi:hypothetical protein
VKSLGTDEFWALYHRLPNHVRAPARQAYQLFISNPDHPSLRYKKLKGHQAMWSVRLGNGYRAIGLRSGENII